MKRTIITLALILALAMSCVALAEETPGNLPAEGTDIVEEMPNDAVPEAPDAPDAPDDAPTSNEPADAAPTDDLKAAMDAYRAAKQDKAVDDLEEELDGYVEEGSLTQEQADLILNSVKERIAAKNGECPNCGYKYGKKDKQFPGQQRFSGQKQFPGQQQFPDQQQSPDQQKQRPGQQQFPGQMGGKQGGCQQKQCPGVQGGQNQMPGNQKQFPGQQRGNQMMPQDNQRPDAQSGATPRNNDKNQLPGQQQMPGNQNQMPGQQQFPGQQNGNQNQMPRNKQQMPQMPGNQQQNGNQMMPGMVPQM